MERIKEYIFAHLHEELTLTHLTRAAALSPAHLTRLFHSQVGQTPMEYVWQQRVKRGVELLEFTGLTVEQIALRCGFKTSYHFSRRVKAITGRTPTQIRRQAGFNAFRISRMGYASAIGVVMFLMALVATIINMRYIKTQEY